MSTKRPTPALAVALMALFVALGGTGYAAIKVTGKDVKNRSLTGKDVKRNSLGGAEIRESRLAKVKRAGSADRVGTVPSAGSAGALAPAGASGLVRAERVTTSGVVKMPRQGSSPQTSPTRTLFKRGPFTVTTRCIDMGAGVTRNLIRVESSEPGSVLGGDEVASLEGAVTNSSFDHEPVFVALQAPSGAHAAMSIDTVVNGLGSNCATAVSALSTP